MSRPDGLAPDELRRLKLERGTSPYAEGSCRVSLGDTVVLCTASVEEGVPGWRRGTGLGWLTAEYAMLPRATTERTARERNGPGGRTAEIQRLIGRSLRSSLHNFEFGEYTIRVDCDVLQADGGTRTAAISGGAMAVAEACTWMEKELKLPNPFAKLVAAVSVGIVDGEPRLDLVYAEDKTAQVDANIVVLEPDRYVEIQGSAEGRPFSKDEMDRLLELAAAGTSRLFAEQRRTLEW
jgi:ribonuclease PH